MQLFVEESQFYFKVDPSNGSVVESSRGMDKFLTVKRVPGTILDKENANGRIYSTGTMQESLAKAKANGMFANRRFLCTANGHPPSTHPEPTSASHVVTDAYIEKDDASGHNMLFCDWLVLGTDSGRNLKALIECGVTHGTSIRGLGQFNESTKQIERYEFLGCDAVGNPSSGTYTNFADAPYDVRIECVDSNLNTITHSRNDSLVTEAEMHPLVQNMIESFKNQFFENGRIPVITSNNRGEIVGALLMAERSLVSSNLTGADIKSFTDFKEEILGASPPRSTAPTRRPSTEHMTDVANKSIRSVNDADLAMKHLEDTIIDMRVEKDRALNKARASDQLVNSLSEKLKTLPEDLGRIMSEEFKARHDEIIEKLRQEHDSSIAKLNEDRNDEQSKIVEDLQKKSAEILEATLQNSTKLVEDIIQQNCDLVEKLLCRSTDVVENVLRTSEKIINDVQKEAYDVITNLEKKCAIATVAGNTLAEHFAAVKIINKSLIETAKVMAQTKPDVVRHSTRIQRIRQQNTDRSALTK